VWHRVLNSEDCLGGQSAASHTECISDEHLRLPSRCRIIPTITSLCHGVLAFLQGYLVQRDMSYWRGGEEEAPLGIPGLGMVDCFTRAARWKHDTQQGLPIVHAVVSVSGMMNNAILGWEFPTVYASVFGKPRGGQIGWMDHGARNREIRRHDSM
jgi:hypothetical protein